MGKRIVNYTWMQTGNSTPVVDDTTLNHLIAEHTLMRSEVNTIIRAQDKVLGFAVTVCIALVSLVEYLLPDTNQYYLFLGSLAPSAICFLSIYALDLIFQQKRCDAYIARIEKNIHDQLIMRSTNCNSSFGWTSFLLSSIPYKKNEKSPVKIVNIGVSMRQKILLGAMLTVPLMLAFFAYYNRFFLEKTNGSFISFFISSSLEEKAPLLFFFLVYVVFLCFMFFYYIRKILRIDKYIKTVIRDSIPYPVEGYNQPSV